MALSAPVNNGISFGQAGLKNTIPATSSTFGVASFTTGFPNETMLPPTSGGIAPDGKDVNGILNQLSTHQVWLNAGGLYKYDETLAAAVGGYAIGAVVNADDNSKSYINTLSGNTSNPNTGGAGWNVFCDSPLRANLASITGALLVNFQYGNATGAQPYSLYNFMTEMVSPLGFMSTAMQTDVLTGSPVMDHTAAIQAAINTGRNVDLKGLKYNAHTLTQGQSGQTITSSQGVARITKNANGDLFTSNADNVRLQNINFYGDASTPTFTGDGVVMNGNSPVLDMCGSRWMSGRALKCTGGHVAILGTSDIYQTTDTSASGYDIELGVSGTATLYHSIMGITSTQATGGILATSCGTWGVSSSQFGKLTIQAGGAPAGSSGPRVTNNRINGAIYTNAANGVFTCNQFSGGNINFDVGANLNVFDISNILELGTTITNNTGFNTGVWAERNVTGSDATSRFAVRIGGDSSLAIMRYDPADGSCCPDSHIRLKKQKNIYMQNTAATGDNVVLSTDTSDNLTLGAVGLRNLNLIAGTGAIYCSTSSGIVQNQAVTPYYRLLGTSSGNQGDMFVSGASLGFRLNGSNGVRLESASLRPETDNVLALGGASFRYTTVYASTGAINTSDERQKQQWRSLQDAEKAAALEIKSTIGIYKFNDAVEIKGDGARWHVGVKAQQVARILESHGLKPMDYAFVCFDEWDEQLEIKHAGLPEIKDKKGNITREATPDIVEQPYRAAGDRWGVRYEELIMFILAAI